jgi:hypothetical protein
LKSLQTAGLANLPRKICAPRKLPNRCYGALSTDVLAEPLVSRPATGLPAAGFFFTARAGSLFIETTEDASVSTNIDQDEDHDTAVYRRSSHFCRFMRGCVAASKSDVTWQGIAICAVLYWLRSVPDIIGTGAEVPSHSGNSPVGPSAAPNPNWLDSETKMASCSTHHCTALAYIGD